MRETSSPSSETSDGRFFCSERRSSRDTSRRRSLASTSSSPSSERSASEAGSDMGGCSREFSEKLSSLYGPRAAQRSCGGAEKTRKTASRDTTCGFSEFKRSTLLDHLVEGLERTDADDRALPLG